MTRREIVDAAIRKILDNWTHWSEASGEAAQCAQDDAEYDACMRAYLTLVIEAALDEEDARVLP